MTEVHYGICNFCDALCGPEPTVDERRVTSIRGDRHDPFSQGHVCRKGLAQQVVNGQPVVVERLGGPG